MIVEPHITQDWDEHWNPVCIPDCPRCEQEKHMRLRIAIWLWLQAEAIRWWFAGIV